MLPDFVWLVGRLCMGCGTLLIPFVPVRAGEMLPIFCLLSFSVLEGGVRFPLAMATWLSLIVF